jgi:hypothetical protein
MQRLGKTRPTPRPEAVLQVQLGHKTLSRVKNDLLVLTGSGTWGCQQPS